MSNKTIGRGVRRGSGGAGVLRLAGLVALGVAGVVARSADQATPGAAQRAPAGKLVTAKGSLVRRAAAGKPWQLVNQDEPLFRGDLLVGRAGAQVESSNGAVRLTLMSDLDFLSPYPIRECAIALQADPKVDLAFVLDRGRVDVVNHKAQGPARVRVGAWRHTWELTLDEPGTHITLELFGRWPAGTAFTKTPGPQDAPTASLVFLVLKGRVHLQSGAFEHVLAAPPGPALIAWDSVTGMDDTPHRLDQLPAWASPSTEASPAAKKKIAARDHLIQLILSKGIDAAVDTLINSEDADDREVAIVVMGALDELPRLGKAMRNAKHPDVWENGVLTLRHWIGRAPGQDQLLYQGLVQSGNFAPVEAETVLQLLHSYGEADLARPETYETLIAYLDHPQVAIRGLAYWHLSRLVPAGKQFGYNPLDPKDKRAAAIAQWKKLIPGGQLPPKSKSENPK